MFRRFGHISSCFAAHFLRVWVLCDMDMDMIDSWLGRAIRDQNPKSQLSRPTRPRPVNDGPISAG